MDHICIYPTETKILVTKTLQTINPTVTLFIRSGHIHAKSLFGQRTHTLGKGMIQKVALHRITSSHELPTLITIKIGGTTWEYPLWFLKLFTDECTNNTILFPWSTLFSDFIPCGVPLTYCEFTICFMCASECKITIELLRKTDLCKERFMVNSINTSKKLVHGTITRLGEKDIRWESDRPWKEFMSFASFLADPSIELRENDDLGIEQYVIGFRSGMVGHLWEEYYKYYEDANR